MSIDGTLIEADRFRTPGSTMGADLWWSGKHDQHGGNVPVITGPDGWPIWTSEVRSRREHDTTATRTHAEILPTLAEAGADLRTHGDLDYEDLADIVIIAFKIPKKRRTAARRTAVQQSHNSLRAIGERGNFLLKMTFRTLRNVGLNFWWIGKIVAAALVILHIEHNQTT